MKHTHAFLRKEFSKIRDEITRNYVLNTLTKSDEELQQPDIEQWCFKKNYSRHYAIAIRQFIKDEILGDIPRKEKPDIVKTVRILMDPYKEGENPHG